MGVAEVEAFLTHLAVDERASASTQNQALAALLFLYREALHTNSGAIDAVRARADTRLPSVLANDEVRQVIARLTSVHALMTSLLYGNGLRLAVSLPNRFWNACGCVSRTLTLTAARFVCVMRKEMRIARPCRPARRESH